VRTYGIVDMLKVGSTLCSIEVDGGEAEDTQEDLAAAVDLSGSMANLLVPGVARISRAGVDDDDDDEAGT
jgi:hypothetical protein